MAILKIKDADGNVQEILAIKGEKGEKGEKGDIGDKGDSYVLTEEDKQEIAGMVSGDGSGGSDADLSNYYTKEETDSAISDAVGDIDTSDIDLSHYYTIDEMESNYYDNATVDAKFDKKLDKSAFGAVYSLAYSTGLEIEGDTVVGIGDCEDEHISIPEFASDGTKITDVADGVFGANLGSDYTHIKSITFPPSIKKLHGEVLNTEYCSNLNAIHLLNPFVEWDNIQVTVDTPAKEAMAVNTGANIFYGGSREDWVNINQAGEKTLIKVALPYFPTLHYAHFTTKEQVLALIQANMPDNGDEESY